MIRLNYQQAQFVEDLFIHMEKTDPEGAKRHPEVSEIRAQINDQLANPGNSVLDKIQDLLSGRFARNVISGDVLLAVRRSILNPSELRKLDAENRSFSCVACGRRIDSGELVTYNLRGGDNMIFCVNCQEPELAPCEKCHQKRRIASSIHRLLARVRLTCECKGKKPEDIVIDIEATPRLNPVFDNLPEPAPPIPPPPGIGRAATIPFRNQTVQTGQVPTATLNRFTEDEQRRLRADGMQRNLDRRLRNEAAALRQLRNEAPATAWTQTMPPPLTLDELQDVVNRVNVPTPAEDL